MDIKAFISAQMRNKYEPEYVLWRNHLPGSLFALGSSGDWFITRTSILLMRIPELVWFGMSKSQVNGLSCLN